MALVDVNKVEDLDHPTEAGVTIGIRSLRATEMDDAKQVRQMFNMASMADAVETVAKFTNAKAPSTTPSSEAEPEEETIEDRVRPYDRATLVKYAVVRWSYEPAVSPESLNNLDAITRDWLAEEVVKRNTRPTKRPNGSGSNSNSVEPQPS